MADFLVCDLEMDGYLPQDARFFNHQGRCDRVKQWFGEDIVNLYSIGSLQIGPLLWT
jgi:hypothetical protein